MVTVETPPDNLSELTAIQDLTEMQEALIDVECEKAKASLRKALRLDLGSSVDYEAIDQAVAEGFDEVKAKLILNVTSKVLYRGGLLSLVSDDEKVRCGVVVDFYGRRTQGVTAFGSPHFDSVPMREIVLLLPRDEKHRSLRDGSGNIRSRCAAPRVARDGKCGLKLRPCVRWHHCLL